MALESLFFSYAFGSNDEMFVRHVQYFLSKQPAIKSFFWSRDATEEVWYDQVAKKIQDCGVFVIFAGTHAGQTQKREISFCNELKDKTRILVRLSDQIDAGLQFLTSDLAEVREPGAGPIQATKPSRAEALICARAIANRLKMHFVPDDEIPVGYPFDYEKHIIDEYKKLDGKASSASVARGCPESWPELEPDQPWYDNPLSPDEIGSFRGLKDRIIVDPRARDGITTLLTLLEAGPRARLRYPTPGGGQRLLRAGVLVSGGIAPGINAVIDGIVQRHTLYCGRTIQEREKYNLEVYGYMEGFRAFFQAGVNRKRLGVNFVEAAAERGGSVLGTSRPEELLCDDPILRAGHLKHVVTRLRDDGIHILYVIGGDGSMRAAHAIQVTAQRNNIRLSVVGIPKTMDNDILWVWQSFGFLSAVEQARDVILNLHTEVTSNPRLAIVQLFGSDSGFVASHAAYSTACDLVLIPEEPLTMDEISSHLIGRLNERLQRSAETQSSPYALVVMAETALPKDAKEYIDNPRVHLSEEERNAVEIFLAQDRRVTGQTPDALRRAALKMLSRILQERIRSMNPEPNSGIDSFDPEPYWQKFRVVTNEPRHLIRSIRPSVSDVIFGERLGTLAVDNAMAGFKDFMVSQWLTEFVLVPLQLVILGRKRVPTNGIFWKSVRAKTGQPAGTV